MKLKLVAAKLRQIVVAGCCRLWARIRRQNLEKMALVAFETRHYTRAAMLLRFIHRREYVCRRAMISSSSTRRQRALLTRLESANDQWDRSNAMPAYLQRSSTADVALERFRVLFVVPEFIHNNSSYIKCDYEDQFFASAREAGLQAELFYSDAISYPTIGFKPSKAARGLQALNERVEEIRPDIIFFDANYLPTLESLNPEMLNALKERHSCKLIGFLADAWDPTWGVPIANRWSACSDIIVHNAPDSPVARAVRHPEKMFWSAHPQNGASFYPAERKNIDVFFSGTYYQDFRCLFLAAAAAKARRLGLTEFILPHKRESCVGLTMEEYASLMRRARIVMNFSSRGQLKAMTGRTWQAIACGAVLLNEDNPFLEAHFVPYVHFIPFTTVTDLTDWITILAHEPAIADRIGTAAAAWSKRHYNSRSIWTDIIGAAIGNLEDREVAHA